MGPFNGLLYAELKVITLYSQEHKGNHTPSECIGSHFNKISALLIMLVHSLQTNKRWGSTKAGQIILIKHPFHLSVMVSPWVTTFILQLHLDVMLELIKFCENRYYRDIFIWANI